MFGNKWIYNYLFLTNLSISLYELAYNYFIYSSSNSYNVFLLSNEKDIFDTNFSIYSLN